jgi:NTP pyrophosphatase (non-canonical NTP hydrolase)
MQVKLLRGTNLSVEEMIEFLSSYIEWTKPIWNDKGAEQNFEHYMLGLFSEIGEIASARKKVVAYNKAFDSTNAKEELGDMLYFFARYIDETNVDIPCLVYSVYSNQLFSRNAELPLYECVVSLCKCALSMDEIKNNPDIAHVNIYASHMLTVLLDTFSTLSVTIEEIRAINEAKLNHRHENRTFSAERATDSRDTQGEREAMQNAQIDESAKTESAG